MICSGAATVGRVPRTSAPFRWGGALVAFAWPWGALRDRLVASQNDWHDTLARVAGDLPKAGKAPPDYCRQMVFELVGVRLAYQQHVKLFRALNARARAEEAVARILDDAEDAL